MSTAPVFRMGSIAAFLQLLVIIAYGIVTISLGERPSDIREIFEAFQRTPLTVFLTGDLPLLILIGLYIGSFTAVYYALRAVAPSVVLLCTVGTMLGVLISFVTESSFSLWYLSKQYAQASLQSQQEMIIAAGQAILASGWWHSTSSYLAGIFLQGSGAIVSLVMLRSKQFYRITALSGVLANSLDLIQHLLSPFVSGMHETIAPVMGLFYLLWYPLLAWNLWPRQRSACTATGPELS